MSESEQPKFERLVATMHRLRAPGGCPWDAEQTHASLKPYAIEEAHELCDAVDRGDDDSLRDELGDLLLQVLFHAELASERSAFTISDVVDHLNAKLIRRHPHVFSDGTAATSEEVVTNWARIKREERAGKEQRDSESTSVLAGVPRSLPALLRAHRLGERAATIGFDWTTIDGVRSKIREELGELALAEDAGDEQRVGEEIGDLLYTLASYSRHCGTRAETLLHAALDRFQDRFAAMEQEATVSGSSLDARDEEAWNAAWERAKARA